MSGIDHSIGQGCEIKSAYEPYLRCHDLDVADKRQSPNHWMKSAWETVVPTGLAVERKHPDPAGGAAGAGTTMGDRTSKPPNASYGDNTSVRDPSATAPHYKGGPEPAAGRGPTIHAEVKKAHMAGEPPISKDNTPERMLVEELQAKIKGSPEAAGIARRGVDEPGGYIETLGVQAKERARQNASGMAELPDKLGRIGEAVGGVASHIAKGAASAVMDFPKNVAHEHEQESVQHQIARERGDGDPDKGFVNPYDPLGKSTRARALGSYDRIDPKPGAEFSDLRRQRILSGLENPDPARKRETLKDEWLYPFTKDYGNPENAEQAAKSYNEYREEKARLADEQAQREELEKQQQRQQEAPPEGQTQPVEAQPEEERKREGVLQRLGHLFLGKRGGQEGEAERGTEEESGLEAESHPEAEFKSAGIDQGEGAKEGEAGPMGRGGVAAQVLRWSKGVGLPPEQHPKSEEKVGPEEGVQAGAVKEEAQPEIPAAHLMEAMPEFGEVQPKASEGLGSAEGRGEAEPAGEARAGGQKSVGMERMSPTQEDVGNVEAGATFSA